MADWTNPGLTRMFRPVSIAVIGASGRRAAKGNAALRNLQAHEFSGQIHVVHPTAESIDGLVPVRTIADLPNGVDVALLSLPAPAIVDAVRDLARVGCGSVVVPAVGMSRDDELALVEVAGSAQMPVLGPNCMGAINVGDGIPLWFYEGMLTSEKPGGVAIVSQSGSACMFVVRSTENVGFSSIVSSGSELCLSTADFLSWLATDEQTRAVACVIESIPDVDEFVRAVEQLRSAGKPLAVLKVGRTSVGARAAVAHTGAMIGKDEAYLSLFRDLDVPVLHDYDELATLMQCYNVESLPQPASRGIGVVTISGGQAALAGDLAEGLGVELPTLDALTAAGLAVAQPGSAPTNPFDAGMSVSAPPDGFLQSVRLVSRDPSVGSVVVILDAQASLNDNEVMFTMGHFEAVRTVALETLDKPVVVASSSAVSVHPDYVLALGERVPILRGIRNGLAAVSALAMNRRPVTAQPSTPVVDVGTAEVERLRSLLAGCEGVVPEPVTRAVLSAYGIPFVESQVVGDLDEALAWTGRHGYPAVLKISSPDIAHRSDVGGVRTGIHDDDELAQALADIAAGVAARLPSARIDGFEIQQHVEDSTEALVGFVRDPVFGSVVTVGTGGTLVEILRDTQIAPGVVGSDEAESMIGRTRFGSLLAGYRSLIPRTEVAPLAEFVSRVSQLASDLGDVLAEGDFNPVLVAHGTGTALAVDCLLVASPCETPQPALLEAVTA